MQAIQNIDLGGSGIGSDQAIFRLLDEELTFNNLVATVTDPRITADDGLLVYYDNPSVATAAGITISWTAGAVTFTAAQAPSSTVVVTIYDIKPALANVWDSIGADEVSYDNTDSGLTSTTVQDAIDEVAQGGGTGGLDLIWSNPDDTQTMTAGTLATLSDQPTYKMFVVLSRYAYDVSVYMSAMSISGLTGITYMHNGGSLEDERRFTITQTGSSIEIACTDNKEYSGTTPTTKNQFNIISKVYGIK